MGKKSKKGVSRAGRAARPAAGQGKTPRSGRSRSQGGSVTSKDELCNLSIDSSDLMLKAAALNNQNGGAAVASAAGKKSTMAPPKNVSVFSPVKELVTSSTVAMSPESGDEENKQVIAAALKEKVQPVLTQAEKTATAGVPKEAESLAYTAAAAAASAKDEDLWSNKLRDVVNNEPAAVLDITMDEGPSDEEPTATKARALPIEDEVVAAQSRGIISLDEPAPGEAKNKTNECGCVIL